MTHLAASAGTVIAADMVSAFHATDIALLSNVRMAASVLEGVQGSGMHPRTKQKLLDTMSAGYGKILEGRKEMLHAQAQMVVIQRQSNLEPVDFGCWGAPDAIFTTASGADHDAFASVDLS